MYALREKFKFIIFFYLMDSHKVIISVLKFILSVKINRENITVELDTSYL